MNNKSEVLMDNQSNALNIISWLFGVAVLTVGLINTFWGNDAAFGVFLILLSFVYFLPVNAILQNLAGFSIPKMTILKIALGIFIIWASLGVGELFDKIELMMIDFTNTSAK